MPKNEPHDTDSIKKLIREAGLRATPARIATLRLLLVALAPLTHAEVANELADSGVDKTTVFRNLNDLAGAGILRRTELGDHVWRFELVSKNGHDASAHPHFVCVDCGVVSCMDDIKLTAGSIRLSEQFGTVTEILLRGQCHECE